MCRFVQGLSTQCLFWLLALSLAGCHDSQPEQSVEKNSTLSLKIKTQKAPDVLLDSREVPAFEQHGAWTELAMQFMDVWTSGESLKIKQPNLAWKHYREIMPCLWQGELPEWFDHEKVFQPTFGKFVGVLSSAVKEVGEKDAGFGPRYYLETTCQWKNATALLRFTFETAVDGKPVITGVWLTKAPEGPGLPKFRSNGYIVGQEMMRLAGYPDRDQIMGWRVKGGGWWTAPKWSSNFLIPVRVSVAGLKGDIDKKWRVKLWCDPTSSSNNTRGQETTVEGKRWIRCYDPPPDRVSPDFCLEAVPGDYRISIEIPRKQLIPKNPSGELWDEVKPIGYSFTVFSDVISIDDSTSALDVQVTVPETVEQQRREMLNEVADRSTASKSNALEK